MWLEKPHHVALKDEALASLAADEVLCETIVSAISPGTELAAWRGLPRLRPNVTYPRLQGYCNVARVLACRSAVTSLSPGDRVLTLSSHRSHFIAPESAVLFRLPDSADADALATTYLFHLGYNAVLRGDVRAGHRVLVIGLGALGLTSVAMAALAGAETIAVSSHSTPASIAAQFGARATYAREDTNDLKSALEPGADVVILTTNSWEDYALALELAAQNGTIACLGFPGRGEPPGDFNPLASEHFYMKQLRIEAVGWSPLEPDPRGFIRFNQRDNIAFLARAITEGRLDPNPMISARYRGEDIAQAYADLDARKDDAVTYLLDWSS